MKKRIIIVGNGFASLFFIQYFLPLPIFPFFAFFFRRIYSRYQISVIGNGKFVYFPAIPDFIIGTKDTNHVTIDIRPFLRRRNIELIDGIVTDIQDGGRTVITNNGTYENDALFLGVGPSFLKDDIPGTEKHTFSPCAGPNQMESLVDKLHKLDGGTIYLGFKANKKDGFVGGRGGQMYECACLIDYYLRNKRVRDRFEIHFFSPNLTPGDKGAITDSLQKRDIVLDYGYEPAEFVDGGMIDDDGSFRKAHLILYSPGITGPSFARQSCLPVSAGGHIDVDNHGQARGLSNVFAAGDCASHEDPPRWIPHQAHMAQLRSRSAAKNMKATLSGESPNDIYRYELSCILNMGNDALWLHRADDDKPPFWNIFPRRSVKLIRLKNLLESAYLFYLRYL
ncbi:MAG: FAD-dependent oxidoreductase [Hyphomicrobiales bacterium]|nr:FAD-dependent oxidoreductase [Hyphomicrobiales bacterium]